MRLSDQPWLCRVINSSFILKVRSLLSGIGIGIPPLDKIENGVMRCEFWTNKMNGERHKIMPLSFHYITHAQDCQVRDCRNGERWYDRGRDLRIQENFKKVVIKM